MSTVNFTQEQVDALRAKYRKSRGVEASVSATNVEQTASLRPLEKKKNKRLAAQSCVRNMQVLSYRHRLCDSDGVSPKAIVDGFVRAGILVDDSPKFVKVTQDQFKIGTDEKEYTVIQII